MWITGYICLGDTAFEWPCYVETAGNSFGACPVALDVQTAQHKKIMMLGAIEIFATVWGAYNYEICKVIGPCICSFGWTSHSTYRVEDGCLREHITDMDKPLLGLWNIGYNPGKDQKLIFRTTGDTLVSEVILGGTKRGEGAVLERGATEVVLLGLQVKKSQMES